MNTTPIPKKPTLSLLSAARNNCMNEVFWTSEPMQIGKTFWLVSLYYNNIDKSFFTGFHYHDPHFKRYIPCDEWKAEEDHPSYNSNGTFNGLPKTLVKLYKKHEKIISKVISSGSKEKGIEFINNFNNTPTTLF